MQAVQNDHSPRFLTLDAKQVRRRKGRYWKGPLKIWRNNYRTIGIEEGYSADEIEEYGRIIDFLSSMLARSNG